MNAPSPLALAAMLYRLNFPNREFTKLPAHVQESYRQDAVRLLAMMKGGT